MSRKKRILLFALLCLAILVGPFVWSRFSSPARRVRIRHSGDASTSNTPTQLKVACYNIAHGRGLAIENWINETPPERLARLDEIAALLKEMDADIVALNEVDFSSSWSHQVNQAEYIARKAGYEYWAEERNLDFRVLHYTWKFGNAVLSRHPIVRAEEVSLPSYQIWETWLAGKKRGLLCEIQLGPEADATKIRFVSAHLSHRSEDVRVDSAKMLCRLAERGSPMIVAGDLNSTPPDFERSSQSTDGDNAISVFDAAGIFQRLPQSMPLSDGMTFRADEPTHVIDWIFVPSSMAFVEYEVVDSELSDHRPVSAIVTVGG